MSHPIIKGVIQYALFDKTTNELIAGPTWNEEDLASQVTSKRVIAQVIVDISAMCNVHNSGYNFGGDHPSDAPSPFGVSPDQIRRTVRTLEMSEIIPLHGIRHTRRCNNQRQTNKRKINVV